VRLLVTIHDVAPALRSECDALWAMCREVGITPGLLVVPNWHGISPLEGDGATQAWLHARVADGAEIFLHGERHDEVGLPRTMADSWKAFGRTAMEGEFLTLDHAAALERMTRGLAVLQRAGLSPIGFIPPAWLARAGCWSAAKTLGLQFGEEHADVILVQSGQRLPTPNLCWSGRTPIRAVISARVVAYQRAQLQPGQLARLALHPADMRHPATAGGIRETLAWLLARGARAVSYASLSPAPASVAA
jgi:predicted deacetylase